MLTPVTIDRFSIPFRHWSVKVSRLDRATGEAPDTLGQIVTALDDLGQAIASIILTPKKSVPTEPEKCIDWDGITDKHPDIGVPMLEREVWDALSIWEPRIVVQKVEIAQAAFSHFTVKVFWRPIEPARTTMRFTLTMVRPTQVAVPAGTRIAAPGGIVLATDADLVIAAGEIFGDITATATEPGGSWNGLAAGKITDLLDPVAWVSTVENIEPVSGGASLEDQERFRLRVVNALFTIAKTGPRAGYREHVKAVHPDIVDVAVIRPEPGIIHIYPLLPTGAPDAALKEAIDVYLDPETLRPMGDDVYVLDPARLGFEFAVTVRTLAVVPGIAVSAEAAVRAAFRQWELTLGSQIAPSDIINAVKKLAGVTDVETDLEFTDLAAHQFAGIDDLMLTVEVTPNV